MNKRYLIEGKEVWARCVLCGAEIPVMTARTGKPYILCHCGLQTFFRTYPSIVRLEQATKDPEVVTFFFKEGHDKTVDVEEIEGAVERTANSLNAPIQRNEQMEYIHSDLAAEKLNRARNTPHNASCSSSSPTMSSFKGKRPTSTENTSSIASVVTEKNPYQSGNPWQMPAKTKDSSKSTTTGSVAGIAYYLVIFCLLGLGLLTGVQYLQSASAKARLTPYFAARARNQAAGG